MSSIDAIPEGARAGGGSHTATRSGTVASGFGSAAEDVTVKRIDLNEALIDHPDATFVMRASGHAMREAGIDSGDVLLVDRAVTPAHGQVVVAVVDDELLCRRLWRQHDETRLQAAAPGVEELPITQDTRCELWGVVTYVIKRLAR